MLHDHANQFKQQKLEYFPWNVFPDTVVFVHAFCTILSADNTYLLFSQLILYAQNVELFK